MKKHDTDIRVPVGKKDEQDEANMSTSKGWNGKCEPGVELAQPLTHDGCRANNQRRQKLDITMIGVVEASEERDDLDSLA